MYVNIKRAKQLFVPGTVMLTKAYSHAELYTIVSCDDIERVHNVDLLSYDFNEERYVTRANLLARSKVYKLDIVVHAWKDCVVYTDAQAQLNAQMVYIRFPENKIGIRPSTDVIEFIEFVDD